MLKKCLIGFVILISLLGGALYYSYSNINQYIKLAVEKYGTAATEAPVSLSKVNLALQQGEGTLEGLTIGNPKGFATSRAIYLGLVTIKLDPHSVPGSGPIIIERVVISQPEITYEMRGAGDSNLQALQKNAQTYVSQVAGHSQGATTESESAKKSEKEGRKIIIRDLRIENGKIAVSHALLQGRQLAVPLPTIHLTNLGNGSGASPAVIGSEILTAITKEASQVSVASLTQQFGGLLNPASGQVSKLKDQVRGLFSP